MAIETYTLESQIDRLSEQAWPEFLLHGDTRHWGSLFSTFTAYQVVFYEPGDRVIAFGHCIPLVWDGALDDLPETIDEILVRGVRDQEQQRHPTAISALAAVVDKDHQGKGLSAAILQQMRAVAARYGCQALIAPVRPTLKSRYPLASFERYVQWKNEDQSPFDPWMRVHWRQGAQVLKPALKAMTVKGSVADWEAWTAMRFPESGAYIVPGALQPVIIDRDQDLGIYEDPNIWMVHSTVTHSKPPGDS